MAVATEERSTHVLYTTTHRPDHDSPISDTVVEAIAAVEDVDPPDLSTRLYDSIDVDGLNRIYAAATDRDDHFRIVFTVGDYDVCIEDRGYIQICAVQPDGHP